MLIEAKCRGCDYMFYPDLNWNRRCEQCKGTDVYWITDEENYGPTGYEEEMTDEEE